MNVIDTIYADEIEDGDLITIQENDLHPYDILRVKSQVDEGEFVFVSAVSEIDGDSVDYNLDPAERVDVMGA